MNNNSVGYNIRKFIVFFLLTLFFQQLSPYISIMGIGPNIAFILVMCSSMLEEEAPNEIYAMVFGLIYDYMNGKVFGVYIILFVVISWGTSELYHRYFENMTMVEILVLVLSFFIYGLLFSVFFALSDEEFTPIFVRISLMEFIYNSILGLIVYTIYRKIITRPAKRKNYAWRI